MRCSIFGSLSATSAMVARRCIRFLPFPGCGLRSGPRGRAVAATCCISLSCARASILLRYASFGGFCRDVSLSVIALTPSQLTTPAESRSICAPTRPLAVRAGRPHLHCVYTQQQPTAREAMSLACIDHAALSGEEWIGVEAESRHP